MHTVHFHMVPGLLGSHSVERREGLQDEQLRVLVTKGESQENCRNQTEMSKSTVGPCPTLRRDRSSLEPDILQADGGPAGRRAGPGGEPLGGGGHSSTLDAADLLVPGTK